MWLERKYGNTGRDTIPYLLKQVGVYEQRLRTAIAQNVCCLFAFKMPIEWCEI
jgi:hypothetical protein